MIAECFKKPIEIIVSIEEENKKKQFIEIKPRFKKKIEKKYSTTKLTDVTIIKNFWFVSIN